MEGARGSGAAADGGACVADTDYPDLDGVAAEASDGRRGFELPRGHQGADCGLALAGTAPSW